MKENWTPEQREQFLAGLEEKYKSPFPPVGEETLAGGLSNTIAGRICNQFNLKGGGYTVDGACASSLLATANACSALVAGDLDAAVAGGVDLSLDPFEVVGFAKTGALAPDEMRVFDKRSAGFWPGEGCGMVVLMRHEDALAQGRRVYAVIRGWGISSDGSGGMTRPESDGQLKRSAAPIAAQVLASKPLPTAKATAPAPRSATPRNSKCFRGRGGKRKRRFHPRPSAHQSQHRPHQSRRRHRRFDQGHDGRPHAGSAADHRLRAAAPATHRVRRPPCACCARRRFGRKTARSARAPQNPKTPKPQNPNSKNSLKINQLLFNDLIHVRCLLQIKKTAKWPKYTPNFKPTLIRKNKIRCIDSNGFCFN